MLVPSLWGHRMHLGFLSLKHHRWWRWHSILPFLGTWAGTSLLIREGGHKTAASRKGKGSCWEVSWACQALLQGWT